MSEGERKKPTELDQFCELAVNLSEKRGVTLDVALQLIIAYELRCIHSHIDKREEAQKG